MSSEQRAIVRREGEIVDAPRRDAGVRGRRGPHPITIPAAPPRLHYMDILRRRWLTALLIFATVVAGVTAGTVLRTPVYRATGLLEIRPDTGAAMPLEALFTPTGLSNDNLNTQFGILGSSTLATRVIDTLNLGEVPEFGATSGRWPGSVRRTLTRQEIVQRFQQRLLVTPQEGSRLVRVGFESRDPVLAAGVVNTVFDAFAAMRGEDAERSAEWLRAQLAEARTRLEESQQRLQAYVRQHGLQVLETGQGETQNLVNDRLRQLHEQLAAAQAERYQRQSAYESTRRQAAGEGADIDSPVIQNLTVRLADLRREAAGLEVTFHDDYPKLQEVRKQIQALEQALREEARLSVSRTLREFSAAERREALVRQALTQQQQTVQALQSESAGYESLKAAVVSHQQLHTLLDQKLKEVEVSSALKSVSTGVVDRAAVPLSPYSSPFAMNVTLGVLLGMLLAAGGAFAREYTDGSVRTVHDIDGQLGGVPALALIPRMTGGAIPLPVRRGSAGLLPLAGTGGSAVPSRRWYRLDRDSQQQSALVEAFAALGTSVLLRDGAPQPRTLLVTSSQPGEGKTTVAVNLALTLGRLNRRVLLVDGDLRRPSVHDALGLAPNAGFERYLAGHAEWRTVVRSTTFANLQVLVGSQPDVSPTELLSTPRLHQLIEEAQGEYDFVVLDSPPLIVYPADVRMLAAAADGTLLTVRGGLTTRDVVGEAAGQLPRLLGLVLNGFTTTKSMAYDQG